jgi:hypothetical protein
VLTNTKEITKEWNYEAGWTRASPRVSDLENVKRLTSAVHSTRVNNCVVP